MEGKTGTHGVGEELKISKFFNLPSWYTANFLLLLWDVN